MINKKIAFMAIPIFVAAILVTGIIVVSMGGEAYAAKDTKKVIIQISNPLTPEVQGTCVVDTSEGVLIVETNEDGVAHPDVPKGDSSVDISCSVPIQGGAGSCQSFEETISLKPKGATVAKIELVACIL